MTDPDVLQAMQRVLDQMQEQQAQQRAAHGGAYVVLARHLAALGHADLPALARDLDRLRLSQPDAQWHAQELEVLVGALRLVQTPSKSGR